MGDLFWDIATSSPVLWFVAAVLGAALIVGYFPLLKWLPMIGQYVPVARLVVILTAALLCFLIGFRVADERAETAALRNKVAAQAIDLEAADEAAKESDKAKAELAEQAKADQERIADYAEQLKSRPNGACTLTPDDFPGGLRTRRNP